MFSDLTSNNLPVNDNVKLYSCYSYTGRFSSETGIKAKGIYIAKINPETGESSLPEVIIICGKECIDKCKNQMIIKNSNINFKIIT